MFQSLIVIYISGNFYIINSQLSYPLRSLIYLGSEAKLMSSTKLFSPSKLDDDKFELTDDYIQQTIKVKYFFMYFSFVLSSFKEYM